MKSVLSFLRSSFFVLFCPLILFSLFRCSHKEVTPSTKKVNSTSAIQNSNYKIDSEKDENLWLEDINGPQALQWVQTHNDSTFKELKSDSRFITFQNKAEEIYTAEDRIPEGSFRGGYVYNFWQDKKNVHGLWRRTTLKEYRKKKPRWETLVDFDELSRIENENWVYKGVGCLPPKYDHCIVTLSRGGKDASLGREFVISKKQFIDGGFQIPESKFTFSWRDENTLILGTDWGPGTLTDSGYPRHLRVWHRGQNISEAQLIFEVEPNYIEAYSDIFFTSQKKFQFFIKSKTFYEKEYFYLNHHDQIVKIPVQIDANFEGVFKNQLIFQLRSSWTQSFKNKIVEYPKGSLISFSISPFELDIKVKSRGLDFNKDEIEIFPIFIPKQSSSVDWLGFTKDFLYLNTLENVQSHLFRYTFEKNKWAVTSVKLPEHGSISPVSFNQFTPELIVNFESFIETERLFLIQDSRTELIKSQPEKFNSKDLQVVQNFSTSKDGTQIPYFIISKKDLSPSSVHPTLLYGYGGFELSQTPFYLSTIGKLWVERGGVFVVANIRGGNEYGPTWHQSVVKENRYKVYEDFISVAEDLIQRKITSPPYLGIKGGSNGGLLVGASFVLRPDLFGAVICEVPLLDMFRYHKLLAGASWMAEYGNPDLPEERKYISTYSPYQNLKEKISYPKVFFVTSTKDDRVHPGHARKMVARMEALGNKVLYYENTDGGHSAAANLKEKSLRAALEYIYLSRELKLD